jgi:hypothetical protein
VYRSSVASDVRMINDCSAAGGITVKQSPVKYIHIMASGNT